MEYLIYLKNQAEKQFNGTITEFDKIDESMKSFFETFPTKYFDSCEDAKPFQLHHENKAKLLNLIDLRC